MKQVILHPLWVILLPAALLLWVNMTTVFAQVRTNLAKADQFSCRLPLKPDELHFTAIYAFTNLWC